MRVLLANEAGGGRGHVTLLRRVALALPRHDRLIAALGRTAHAADLADICARVIPAPRLVRGANTSADPRYPGNASWGDSLAAFGLTRPEVVRRALTYWRDLIVAEEIDLLIADAAPLALLAARGLQDEGWAMRTICIGTGWGVPPYQIPVFPLLFNGMGGVPQPECETLTVVNRVAAETDILPLAALPEIYRADLSLALSFPFLDHYADWRPAGQRMAPPVDVPQAGGGTGVFIYFSAREIARPGVMEALCSLPLARCGYLPRATEAEKSRLRASGMQLAKAPLPPAEIAARSGLVLHAGVHGTISMAAWAGLAQVALPTHLEQLWNARATAAQGALRILPEDGLADAIRAAYADRTLKAAAKALSHDLRAAHPANPAAALTGRLADFLSPAEN